MLRNYNDVITDHPVYRACVDEKLAGVLVLTGRVDLIRSISSPMQ